jgi:hypothetical protein
VRYTGGQVGGRRAAIDGGPFATAEQAAAWCEGKLEKRGIVLPGQRGWREACDMAGKSRWGSM